MRTAPSIAAVALAAALGGCATVPVEDVFSDAAGIVRERTGEEIAWPEVSDDEAAIDARMRELLGAPLDADAAAEAALLGNRRLHARYAELGRAAAASVQAGLPPNPFLEVVARFRDGSGGTPQLEVSVVQELLALFLLPARKRLAAVELERATLDLAGAAVDLAAEARSALVRYQAESRLLALDREVLEAAEAAWEMTVRLREAGNVSQLDLLAERDLYEQTKLEVSRRELRLAEAREDVNLRLGLWGERATAWTAAPLPVVAAEDPPLDDVESRAVARSLDLAAAVLDLEAAARRLGLVDVTSWLPDLEVGAEGEREVEEAGEGDAHGEWWVGPALGVRLPVFDRGGPRRVAASMELRGRWDGLAALGVEVRAAARSAATRLEIARREALHARDVLVPLRAALVAETQLHYNAMFVGVFQLLDAKRRETEARRAEVAALGEYWLARGALERLDAGRLPGAVLVGGRDFRDETMRRAEGAEEEH